MLDRSYHAYIQSERWRLKRELYFAKKGKNCKACKSVENIKIHHLSYDNFGAEPLSDLISLCNTCHVKVHQLHRQSGRRYSIREVTMKYIRQMALQRLRRKMPRR